MEEQTNKNRVFKVLILAIILILPGFLYYLLENKGENRYIVLPIFGEKVLTGTFTSRMGEQIPDTNFHHVQQLNLLNQDGDTVLIPSGPDSTISVVNFFYTRCETFCQHMNDEMNRVAIRFGNNHAVRFYTITVDPVFDTPDVLKEYSRAYNPAQHKWNFLTGDVEPIFDLARNGFLVDALQDTTRDDAFIHSSSLILLDSEHRIRGYYDVNHRKEVDRLIDEVKLLLVEEVRKKSPY